MPLHLFINHLNRVRIRGLKTWPGHQEACDPDKLYFFPASGSTSVKWRQLARGMCRAPFRWKALWFSAFLTHPFLFGEEGTCQKKHCFPGRLTNTCSRGAKMAHSITNDPWDEENQTCAPRTSAGVHFGSSGVRRVWSNMWPRPNTSRLKAAFPETTLLWSSLRAGVPLPTSQSEGGQDGWAGRTQGPCRAFIFHTHNNKNQPTKIKPSLC